MEDYHNYREELNWDSFAEEYHIESDAYIDGVNTILNLECTNSYPMILFPDSFRHNMEREFTICKKEKNQDNVIGIEDFYDAANKINANNPSYEEMKVIFEPKIPKEPQKIEISKTHWETYKTYRYGCMIGVIIGTLAFFSPFWLFSSADIHVKAFCFAGFLLLGIIYILTDNELKKQQTRSIEVPYTKQEMEVRISKNEETYQRSYKKYLKEKADYPKLLEDYQSKKEWQDAYFQDNTNIEELFVYMYHFSFTPSDNYSITDDAPQRGKTENMLFCELMKRIPKFVKVDAQLGCYYPDLVIDTGKVKIDLEIDEPYDYKTKKEIHYIGCNDSKRNRAFLNSNWIVVRFAESQIEDNFDECVVFIELLALSLISENYEIIKKLPYSMPDRIERWTKEEARMMAIDNSRIISKERISENNNKQQLIIGNDEIAVPIRWDNGKLSICDTAFYKDCIKYVPLDLFCKLFGAPAIRRYENLGFTALLCKGEDGEELFVNPPKFKYALTLVDFEKPAQEIANDIAKNVDQLVVAEYKESSSDSLCYWLCDKSLYYFKDVVNYDTAPYWEWNNQIGPIISFNAFCKGHGLLPVLRRYNEINTSVLYFRDEDEEETIVIPSISKLTLVDFSVSPCDIAKALVKYADNLIIIEGNRESDGAPIYYLADKQTL